MTCLVVVGSTKKSLLIKFSTQARNIFLTYARETPLGLQNAWKRSGEREVGEWKRIFVSEVCCLALVSLTFDICVKRSWNHKAEGEVRADQIVSLLALFVSTI